MGNPLNPNKDFEIENEQIEGLLKNIGHLIGSQLPEGWGFNLAIASYGEKGSTFYISNMDREGAADMLEELVAKLRGQSKPS